MNRSVSRSHTGLRLLPVAVAAAVIALSACSDDKKDVIAGKIDPERFATMTTTDVSTLISDSGVIRYHITAPRWLVFDEAKEPHWRFPDGLFLEKFNESFVQDASITADSAIYFKDKQLWRLDGYVEITNPIGERFLTHQLYWNQKEQKVYSDSFIHIERSGRIIEGYGFVSNDRMTKYEVLEVSGIFPSEQFKPGEKQPSADSAAVDSASAGRRLSKPRRINGTYSPDGAVNVIVPSKPKVKSDKKNGLQRSDDASFSFRSLRPAGKPLK